MTRPDAPEGTLGQLLGCLGLVAGLVLLGGAGYWLVTGYVSRNRALARLALASEPAEAKFELGRATAVQVWADIDVRHDGISTMSPNSSLPHVADYVIEFRGEAGVAGSLRCNPFDSNVALTSGTHSSIGEPSGRYYDGRLNGCHVQLPAGTYSVRAWLEPSGAPNPSVVLRKSDLVLRRR